MAIYYVGSGGNDSNGGTSWAQRKLTIQGACNATGANDTIYVAPGTYAEQVQIKSNGLSLIGDYSGANTSGTKGIVRITGGTNETTWGTRSYCINNETTPKTGLTLDGFVMDGSSSELVRCNSGGVTGMTVKRCVFISQAQNVINFSGLAASDAITVQQCIFFQRNSASNNLAAIEFTSSSTLTVAATVQNCIMIGGHRQIYINRAAGITVKNCTLMYGGAQGGIYIATALAGGSTIAVNNCLLYKNQIGVRGTVTGEILEDYNTFFDCNTARTNTATGTNSNTNPLSFDTRWFFESVIASGTLITPWDLASYTMQVELNSGTGAPSTDLRGAAQTGSYREWGALEYNSTLGIAGGGATRPIGSPIIRGLGAV